MGNHKITTLQLLSVTFLLTLANMNVMAFDSIPVSSVVLKQKVYLDNEPANFDVADFVNIEIIEINALNQKECLEESGLFTLNLGLGKHFLIYVSSIGYETQFFEFSTIGVEPEMNLVLYLDITLSQEAEFDNGPTGHLSNYFKYNSVDKDIYINISQGTSIAFDSKGTN